MVTRRTKRKSPIDRPLAKELALSAANDGKLYDRQIRPCILNLARRKIKGVYKKPLAIKLMVYPIESEIKIYRKENYFTMPVSSATKTLAAKYLLDDYSEELRDTVTQMKADKAKKTKKKTTVRRRR